MKGLVKKLIYICIGIFVIADLSFRLKLPGDETPRAGRTPAFERQAVPPPLQTTPPRTAPPRTASARSRAGVESWRRDAGPKIWVRQTGPWGPGDAASKIHEFPEYRAPVNPRGRVKDSQQGGGSSSGTAFAIAPNGVWLTAAHVVEGCRSVLVEAGLKGGRAKRLRASRVTIHPTADVAIIETPDTDFRRRPFTLESPRTRPPGGAGNAFHIGFPRGKPGAVHSRFLGHKKLYRKRGRNNAEDILVWAQISRLPDFSGSLGGLSGGVVLDETGAVIGTNSAENARRGRILTSRPNALWETVRRGGRSADAAPAGRPAVAELTPSTFPLFAKYAIQDRRVVRVICSRGER